MSDENNFYSYQYQESGDKKGFKSYENTLSVTETNIALAKSYLWMFLAMLVTMVTGKFMCDLVTKWGFISFETFIIFFVIAIVGQIVLSFVINKEALVRCNFARSLGYLLLYAILEGTMFSFFFMLFDSSFLYQVFIIVSLYFLLLGGISFLFRKKMHGIANFALAGLITLALVSLMAGIYGFFIIGKGEINDLFTIFLCISVLALLVYSVIAVVDMNSMTRILSNNESKNAASVAAAFVIYLDFVIIFQYIIRILIILGGQKGRK